ncbi:hypothetical protein R1sor_026280 [Riccia sorocarpa]|uniref:BTB domain-containing protein n=1 Tax=Riccia sorocarpa TaxID=122646 RepID=A0ABD3GCN7_9MARC
MAISEEREGRRENGGTLLTSTRELLVVLASAYQLQRRIWNMETPSVKAKIMEKAGQAQEQATADLLADQRKMLNNLEFSDVVFVCGDGERVHACRMVLCARSAMLKNMLTNGMAESRLSEIPLPGIESPVLLSIFEFLYTGTMVEHAPESWRRAFEVISAARFFLLTNLEEIVWEFLAEGTFDLTTDMTTAASNLSVAMDFPSISDANEEAIPLELVRILNSKCVEPAHLRALSGKAFQYFLSKTKKEVEESASPVLSLGEYLRFRQIVLWCTCNACPEEEAEEIVRLYLPDAKKALQLLKDGDMDFASPFQDPCSVVEGSTQYEQFIQLRDDIVTSVANLISMVDLRSIHPELLIKVIEPLEIIPISSLMEALRFHALQRPRVAKGTWEEGAHASFYRIGRDRSVIEKCDFGIGFARASNAICQPYGVYEWDIVIEELCYQFCEVGIYKVNSLSAAKPNFNGASLTQQPTGWALRMDDRGTLINQCNVLGFPWMSYGKKFGYADARVRVSLDMFERTCSYSIDGQKFGVAWNNLPEGIYYPAVSLGSGTLGRVRIELVSGFDLL